MSDQPRLRALWDLWLMLRRLRERADDDALMPPLDIDFEDTAPMTRPAEGEE